MGLLKLISEFDPFLKAHVEKYGNRGKGNVSSLSKTICEEFIQLIAKKVRAQITTEIKNAKYYALIVDSTPDLSHINQLSIIVRYCSSEGVHERFLGIIPIFSHTGISLSKVVTNFLEDNDLELEYCRGESYNNASNMSGQYNGLQTHIQQVVSTVFYIPCFAHSLNLVGECAANICL